MSEIDKPLEQKPFTTNTTKFKEDKKKKRNRIIQLSMPKMSKAVWPTIEPRLVWGNQDPMRPISKSAMNAKASERLENLATPKKNFQSDAPLKCSREYFMYSCGRPSVILDVSPLAMKAAASERIEELAKPKRHITGYTDNRPGYVLGCGRSSPLWEVSDAAKTLKERVRTTQLAQPKTTHRDYQPPRKVEWIVSSAAKNATTPTRIKMLSNPKERKEGPFRYPQWVVGKGARNAQASNRLQDLAKAKKITDGYRPNRDVEWKVPRSAIKACVTVRLTSLAAPIVRDTMDHVQFDPLAFEVKESALKGKVPDRINDLAQPVIRGPKFSK
ncbi:testicular haploid expressed gene protein-like isoform X1 [Hydractinia symbiolongicarpus]|uniref:testicular haploid expressed gene protein-like isoform X1 n=2 Tax=Hydractinia symbiolongicarpus TaxID=13093 RepID=UPI00254EEF08|nr:testicular haploid expressed gene protein-like isoform X1 [Hydractinia symbiolongicarpus]XP_057306814.1 testicular haploid expressed gene protein-like isoform X1 [Hydractinia symbiolongicarpus]XP_057306815.1 testicular haploid expressed gene protein-like isoform X1 [Hydractinia symbiolongicarpus]XP_057306817.1 testicular haploid expressed gene protein-like isoform X1 [Hydractinia symbiolongicarpus]